MLLGSALAVLLAVAPSAGYENAGLEAAAPKTQTLRTPRFTIVHTERAAGPARFLAGKIEAVRDEVARAVGRDWPNVTEVRLGFGREEYEALAVPGERPPPWAVALAYPERNIVLVEAHSLAQGDGQVTLRHELVHVALAGFGRGWPHWYQEGLAMELTQERKFRFSQFATLAEAVAMDRIFAFDDLGESFPSRPEDVEIAYAQSAAFVEFLRDRHGVEAFGALIDRVQAGEPFDTAFGVAFHSSRGVEERAFRRELQLRYPWWPLLLAGGSLVWFFTALLLVAAVIKRRHEVGVHRREQERVERLEDLGHVLIDARERPANDSDPIEPISPWADHLWIVHSVRFYSAPSDREKVVAKPPSGT